MVAAVEVIGGKLIYGPENLGVQDVDLVVPRGTIYGLLGPSGCGKTTLLSTVVGLSKLQKGRVLVFGHPPLSPGSGVPGPWLGYMPQDLCLPSELTAEETLRYFGLVQCLPRSKIQMRIQILMGMLEIPEDRLCRQMSDGQQRRLSLAVAMVHDPPLLVLDEPTVGVDPLLRKVIWQHLLELVNGQSKTVIMTTHYIEEATQAHAVGFMRDGRILDDDVPQQALRKYQAATLGEVFLKLCQKEDFMKAFLVEKLPKRRHSIVGSIREDMVSSRQVLADNRKTGSDNESDGRESTLKRRVCFSTISKTPSCSVPQYKQTVLNDSKDERQSFLDGYCSLWKSVAMNRLIPDSLPTSSTSSHKGVSPDLRSSPNLPNNCAKKFRQISGRTFKSTCRMIYALTWKNLITTRRNYV